MSSNTHTQGRRATLKQAFIKATKAIFTQNKANKCVNTTNTATSTTTDTSSRTATATNTSEKIKNTADTGFVKTRGVKLPSEYDLYYSPTARRAAAAARQDNWWDSLTGVEDSYKETMKNDSGIWELDSSLTDRTSHATLVEAEAGNALGTEVIRQYRKSRFVEDTSDLK